jgi:hypothetical protein
MREGHSVLFRTETIPTALLDFYFKSARLRTRDVGDILCGFSLSQSAIAHIALMPASGSHTSATMSQYPLGIAAGRRAEGLSAGSCISARRPDNSRAESSRPSRMPEGSEMSKMASRSGYSSEWSGSKPPYFRSLFVEETRFHRNCSQNQPITQSAD